MINFIIRKIAYGFLVLFGVISIVFFLFQVLPGDPARLTLGQRADVLSIEAINKEFGLDRPINQQFWMYLNDISPISYHDEKNTDSYVYLDDEKYSYNKLCPLWGDKILVIKKSYLRRSYQTRKKVSEILMEALPGTLILTISSMIFASFIGIILGVMAALKQHSLLDNTSVLFSVIGISTPSFFAGILIAFIFGHVLSSYTGLNMVGGLYGYDDMGERELQLKNLILPMITLGIRPLAIIVQLTRSSMLDVLSQDYIRTAISKGLSYKNVLFKHALRNALNPVVTAISGWFASLIAGTFFIEYVFGWKGIGLVGVNSLLSSDFPVVMGIILLTASVFVVINIFVDILYGMLDPRVSIKS